MTHLLVTNDFPPKVGGIQSYLYELWSRLSPESFAVLTIGHEDAARFDAAQSFRIERLDQSMLVPTRRLRQRIDALAREVGANIVVLDPALPLGALGRSLELPYALVLHGAEVTVPARLPVAQHLLRRVITGADLLVAAGGYPGGEAKRLARDRTPRLVQVPPGVDIDRFQPLGHDERLTARRELGLPEDALLVVSVSRLVPRKGMDVLIEASARLRSRFSNLLVVIGGTGRDRKRLEAQIAKLDAPVRLLGRVADEDLPRLNACADVAAMLCRNRWLGLEQEGFGIVFLEAAACGTVQIAGMSGGAAEAVIDESTGLVLDRPADVAVATNALIRLLEDEGLRMRLGTTARARVVQEFDYRVLADRLQAALAIKAN